MGGVGWAHDGVMPDPHLSQPIPAPLLSMASTAEAVAFSVLASALPDAGAAPDGPPEWIKLTPLGKVQGRDGRGPYDFGDAARAAAVVAASNAYAGTVDPLIDYDHAFDLAAARGLGNAPAAGWIKELQARADGIYARVDGPPPARPSSRAGNTATSARPFITRRTGPCCASCAPR